MLSMCRKLASDPAHHHGLERGSYSGRYAWFRAVTASGRCAVLPNGCPLTDSPVPRTRPPVARGRCEAELFDELRVGGRGIGPQRAQSSWSRSIMVPGRSTSWAASAAPENDHGVSRASYRFHRSP